MDRCWRLSTWSHTLISLELSITMYKNPRTSHINMSLYPRSNFRILLLCTYQWKPSSSMELRNSTSVTWGACQLCERAPWWHWFPLVCAGQQDPGTGDIFMTSVVMVSKFYFFSDFDRYWAGRPLTGILLETRFICRKRSLKLHVKYGLSQKPPVFRQVKLSLTPNCHSMLFENTFARSYIQILLLINDLLRLNL